LTSRISAHAAGSLRTTLAQTAQVASAFLDYVRANADRDVLSHLEATHASQDAAAHVAGEITR
jgi:hypothetical protein